MSLIKARFLSCVAVICFGLWLVSTAMKPVEYDTVTYVPDDTFEVSSTYTQNVVDVREKSDVQISLLYDDLFKQKVWNSMADCSYIEFNQYIVTSASDTLGSVSLGIRCDLANSRCFTELESGSSHSVFYEDNIEEEYASLGADGSWHKSNETARTTNIDLESYTSVVDLYDVLFEDFFIFEKVNGVLVDDFVYFSHTEPATAEDLGDQKYDELGEKKSVLAFRIDGDVYTPYIHHLAVTFSKDGVEYATKNTVTFFDISNTALESPEVVIDEVQES